MPSEPRSYDIPHEHECDSIWDEECSCIAGQIALLREEAEAQFRIGDEDCDEESTRSAFVTWGRMGGLTTRACNEPAVYSKIGRDARFAGFLAQTDESLTPGERLLRAKALRRAQNIRSRVARTIKNNPGIPGGQE